VATKGRADSNSAGGTDRIDRGSAGTEGRPDLLVFMS
jgi:hypothetical protein